MSNVVHPSTMGLSKGQSLSHSTKPKNSKAVDSLFRELPTECCAEFLKIMEKFTSNSINLKQAYSCVEELSRDHPVMEAAIEAMIPSTAQVGSTIPLRCLIRSMLLKMI